MKCYRLDPVGMLDGLKLGEEPEPRPGPREVAIRIGSLAEQAQVNPQRILAKRANVHGIQVGSREMFEAMNRAIAQARLRPAIDRQFEFWDARAAYDYFASRAHFGKVIIRGA
ncbi:MAG: zinc-binding dehydrogenase [Betaproteobacteria bacterium]|nr:zinc-binding dehydrogenase [Betaproteobacteria bacterium]